MNWRTPLLSLVALVVACSTLGESAAVTSKPTVLVMVGAGGESEFADQFKTWAGQWEKAAQAAGARGLNLAPREVALHSKAQFDRVRQRGDENRMLFDAMRRTMLAKDPSFLD